MSVCFGPGVGGAALCGAALCGAACVPVCLLSSPKPSNLLTVLQSEPDLSGEPGVSHLTAGLAGSHWPRERETKRERVTERRIERA